MAKQLTSFVNRCITDTSFTTTVVDVRFCAVVNERAYMPTCESAEIELAQFLIDNGLVAIPSKKRAKAQLDDAKVLSQVRGRPSEFELIAEALFTARDETPGLAELLLHRGRQERDDRTQLSYLRGALRCICTAVSTDQSDALFVRVSTQAIVETPCGLLMTDEDLELVGVAT